MRQFDVFANPFPRSRDRQPFLVNLQTDLMTRALATVVVAPLEPMRPGAYVDKLNPTVALSGRDYAVIVQELVAVRAQGLGRPVESLDAERDKIIGAVDLLFTGF